MRPNVRRMLLAIAFAFAGTLLILVYLQETEKKIVMKGAPSPVVVAKTDIPSRAIISLDMLEIQNVPKPFISPGSFTKMEEVVGMVAITSIPKGTQITQSLLLPPTIWTVLSSFVPEGYRAITIHVDEVKGVGGLILPGDEVDVIATFHIEDLKRFIAEEEFKNYLRILPKDLNKSSFATITYKGLRVLAVGKALLPLPPTKEKKTGIFEISSPGGEISEGISSVTLAVPQKIVKELVLLDNVAEIRLALRSVKEIIDEGDTLLEPPLTVLDLVKKYAGTSPILPSPRKQLPSISYSYINLYKRTEIEKIKLGKEGEVIGEQAPWKKKEEIPFIEKYTTPFLKNMEEILKEFKVPLSQISISPCDTCP